MTIRVGYMETTTPTTMDNNKVVRMIGTLPDKVTGLDNIGISGKRVQSRKTTKAMRNAMSERVM